MILKKIGLRPLSLFISLLGLFTLMNCQQTPSKVATAVPVVTPPSTAQPPLLPPAGNVASEDLKGSCLKALKKLPGKFNEQKLDSVCSEVKRLPVCQSVQGKPIYHFDKTVVRDSQIKILVLALVHGDEPISGSVTRAWMERLVDIAPRNSWRIIPVLNPDGFLKHTRTNANHVDVNRNFPSQDWKREVQNYWVKVRKRNPRLYPGPSSASEPETRCVMEHINDFKPDFIIAVHTPLGLLDFDGPEVKVPKDMAFPWMRVGNYPGSLGRYMWRDNQTPVLTIELKGPGFLNNIEQIDRLQDLSGMIAIMAKQKKEQLEKGRKGEEDDDPESET